MFGHKKPAEVPVVDEGAEQLKKLLTDLPGNIQQSVAAGMATAFKGMQAPTAPTAPAPKADEKPTPAPLIPEGVDLDELSGTDMVKLLLGAMDTKITQLGEAISPKFDQLANAMQTKNIRDDVKDVAGKDPNFWKYQEVMAGIAKQHPSLGAGDLFNLAKTKAPEIGEAIAADKKAADEKEAEDNPEKVVPFGGLTPTSGLSAEGKGEMDFSTAADKAWDDIMSEIPQDIIGGANN